MSSHGSVASQRDRDDRVLAVLLSKDAQIASQTTTIHTLEHRVESILTERDQFEQSLVREQHQSKKLADQINQDQEHLRRAREQVESLSQQLRQQPSFDQRAAEDELQRKAEQIEELIRTVADERARADRAVTSGHQQQSSAAAPESWLAEREEMASLILDQQTRLESLQAQVKQQETEARRFEERVQGLQAKLALAQQQASTAVASSAASSFQTPSPTSQAQIASLERELKRAREHIHELERQKEEEDHANSSHSSGASTASASAIESRSVILAQKQKEVEELRKTNEELRAQLQHAAPNAAPPSSSTPSPAPAVTQALDTLRSQLLLAQSELASKTHALSLAGLEVRELTAKSQAAEEQSARLKSLLQASETKIIQLQERIAGMNTLQAQYDQLERHTAKLEERVRELQDRDIQRERDSIENLARAQEQSDSATHVYHSEVKRVKHMLHSLVRQVQESCGAAAGASASASPSAPASSSSTMDEPFNESEFLTEYNSVLQSISALLASRDMHKLSSVRAEKQVQFLEGEVKKMREEIIHKQDQDSLAQKERDQKDEQREKQYSQAMEALESQLQHRTHQEQQLRHQLQQAEEATTKAISDLETTERKVEALEAKLKQSQTAMKAQQAQSEKDRSSHALALSKAQESLKEKSMQNQVLLETIEALQKAGSVEERHHVIGTTSSGSNHPPPHPSPHTLTMHTSSISTKLLSFSAQLSHSRAQESLLRRTLQETQVELRLAKENEEVLQNDLSTLTQSTIPGLETQVRSLQTQDKSHKLEHARLNGRLARLTEECSALKAEMTQMDTVRLAAVARVDALQTELAASRKRNVEALSKLHTQCQKDMEEHAKAVLAQVRREELISGGGASEPSPAQGIRSGSSSAAALLPQPSSSMQQAVKELSQSILQAVKAINNAPATVAIASPSSGAVLFTPQKFSRGHSAASAPVAAASPSFTLGSPTSAPTAEVPPSSSERAAILPAIFERLLNLVLQTEASVRSSQFQSEVSVFQLERMMHSLFQKETQLDELQSKYSLYKEQHSKLLSILKSKSEMTNLFLREQQRGMNGKIQELQQALFEQQNTCLDAQTREKSLCQQVHALRDQLGQERREKQRLEAEYKQSLQRAQIAAEQSLSQQWHMKEEELKRYVEQVLRPIVIVEGGSSAPSSTQDQLSLLSGTIAALKLIEQDSLLALERTEKENTLLQAQLVSFKAENAELTGRLKLKNAQWVQDGGVPEKNVDERVTQHVRKEFGPDAKLEEEKYPSVESIDPTATKSERNSASRSSRSRAKRPDRSPSSPSSSSSDSENRSRSPSQSSLSTSAPSTPREKRKSRKHSSRSPKRKESKSRKDSKSHRTSSRPSSSQRPRSASPRSLNRLLKTQVSYLSLREQELLLALDQATRVQEQLEGTVEQLIQASRDMEETQRGRVDRSERRYREQQERESDRDRDRDHQRERERDFDDDRSTISAATSGSKSKSSSSKAPSSARPLATNVPGGKTGSAATTSLSSSLKKGSKSAAKLEQAESSMSSTIAQTVLQVTKQLREREAVLAETKSDLAKAKASLLERTEAAEKAQGTLSARRKELAALKEQLRTKNEDLDASMAQARKGEATSKTAQDQLAALESLNAELKRQVAELAAQQTQAQSRVTQDLMQIQTQLLPLGAENTNLKQNLLDLQQKLDHSLRLENSERQKNIELEEILKEAEGERSELQSKIHVLEKDTIKLQDQLNILHGEQQQDRSLFEQELTSREKEKLAMKNMIQSLEQSRMELHINHEHLLRDKQVRENDANIRIHDLESAIEKELTERARMCAREQDFLDRIQQVEQMNQKLLDEKGLDQEKYQADIQALKSANSILENTLHECRRELESLTHIQAELELTTQELKALRCQHMDFISQVNQEREQRNMEMDVAQETIKSLENALQEKSIQLPQELTHQKNLYQEMIMKLKTRLSEFTKEYDVLELENSQLDSKLKHMSELNLSNAESRLKVEQERDLLVQRYEELEKQRELHRIEVENQHSVASQIAQQEFRTLQNTYEEFRKGHEVLVGVYQEQHARLLNRLKRALEYAAEVERKREVKVVVGKKAAASKSNIDASATAEHKLLSDSTKTPFMSDLAQGRLVFDMAELLSNLAERESTVRSLQHELDQMKRVLASVNAERAHGEKFSLARPLTAILSSNSALNNAPTTGQSTLGQSAALSQSQKKEKTAHGTATIASGGKSSSGKKKSTGESDKENNTFAVSLSLHSPPPLTWQEERSLVVLGGELAHMELQLKTAQRSALNEKESAIHFEEQWKLAQLALSESQEKLRETKKELSMLQRHTTGTIKAQEQEIAKITESLRTEEEWAGLLRAVQEGKQAIKTAKEELGRKNKQLTQSHEDILKLKSQLEELESHLSQRDSKITKLTRALQSKDVLVTDLKKKFEEQESEDKSLVEQTKDQTEKLKSSQTSLAKKEKELKDLRAKVDSMTQELELQQAQISSLSTTQSTLKSTQKDLIQTQRKLDELLEDKELLEKQKIELENQLELWKTKQHIQTQGQKNDLAALSREATRIGAAYDTLRNLIRDLALHQVQAIEQLSQTLSDLDRDDGNESIRLDGEISVRDVETLSVAAEFSKEDLEDIISTTLCVDSNRAPINAKSRSAVYARRICAELEVQLARDLSVPSILTLVRSEFVKLLDERVRMELLVLSAATRSGTHAGRDEDAPPRSSRPSAPAPSFSPSSSIRQSSGISRTAASSSAAVSSIEAARRASERELDAASARARSLEEQLQRHDMARAGRVTQAQENARHAREVERSERSRSSSPDTRHRYHPAASSSTRFTAHIYDEQRERHAGDDSVSISSIDSRGY